MIFDLSLNKYIKPSSKVRILFFMNLQSIIKIRRVNPDQIIIKPNFFFSSFSLNNVNFIRTSLLNSLDLNNSKIYMVSLIDISNHFRK